VFGDGGQAVAERRVGGVEAVVVTLWAPSQAAASSRTASPSEAVPAVAVAAGFGLPATVVVWCPPRTCILR
jgi:hypothetical protein